MSEAAVAGDGASREPVTAGERQGSFSAVQMLADYPTPDEVKASVEGFSSGESDWKLSVTPGAVTLRAASGSTARKNSADSRPAGGPKRMITEFSSESELRMMRRFVSLDLTPWREAVDAGRVMAMITLTYPKVWEPLAPTAKATAGHVRAFRWRLERAIGPVAALRKTEFQRRSAPHVHLLAPLPASIRDSPAPEWISKAWFECVNSGDPKHLLAGTGVDWSTPAKGGLDIVRIARYFCKYAAKGKHYQHIVPDIWLENGGSGRFWSVWRLAPITETVSISLDEFIEVRRVLRRLDRSKRRTKKVRVRRVVRRTGRIYYRSVTRRAPNRSLRQSRIVGGSQFTQSGPALMTDLGRFIEVLANQRIQPSQGDTQ